VGSSRASLAEWIELLGRLGLPASESAYRQLANAYGGPGRYYHNLAHVDDCLDQLTKLELDRADADDLAVALWFHDAVYDWRSSTNEADSARLATRFLTTSGASARLVTVVNELIMATRHSTELAPSGLSAVISDIDLSILGRDAVDYDRYEAAIAQEYRWVPGPIYRQGRRKILQSFLDRPSIFRTQRFAHAYEAPARANLARAITAL
jgi:predicted metal-dependent HD superfamily phosphohydrolase